MGVGVIVAARGPVPFLNEALDSVLAQAKDVVVVDHASRPPLALDRPVRVVRLDDADGGPAAARQAGLEVLTTDLVALADADDVWEPAKLDVQLAALVAHPDAAVCFGGVTVIDAGGRDTGERWPEVEPGVLSGWELVSRLYEGNFVPASSAVVRREALEAVGGFPPPLPLAAGSDWDLWLRLAATGHAFLYEPHARVRYRRHEHGLTSSISRLGEAGLAIHERYEDLVPAEAAAAARARDLRTLARGRVRERRYRAAQAALTAAEGLARPSLSDRALKAGLGIPGLREAFGRRDPYR